MSAYETVIGLEVHVHLCTKSKLFCSCPTTFGVEPNTNVCEVCAGMPGVLPVLNQTAVEYATRAGLALDCTINNDSVFARKNYFYPDMPYNYQISQFERPLCEFGHLDINVGGETKRIGITRIHMETDAGKNIHEGDHSYLDLNRAAVPLIEIVSEPDMRSAEEAVAYLKALHAIVVYLGITDGNMEEGSFRCDANVSIRPKGAAEFGTRAELKNLNSFRHVQKAIEYEVSRQGGQAVKDERVIKCRKQGCCRKFFSQLQPAETEHGDIEDRHEAGKRDPEEMLCHKAKSCGSRGDHVQRQNEEDDSRSVDRETEQDNRSLDNGRCCPVLFCF